MFDPQDFGSLDPDPQDFGFLDPDPDPRGNISTKNGRTIFVTLIPNLNCKKKSLFKFPDF